MKFSFSSFLFGVAATAVVYAAKNKSLLRSMISGTKRKPGEKPQPSTTLADTGKRAEIVISEIA